VALSDENDRARGACCAARRFISSVDPGEKRGCKSAIRAWNTTSASPPFLAIAIFNTYV
jgi:hypothetical protein